MIVAVPPLRSIANDCSAVTFSPMASKAYSVPPSARAPALHRVAGPGVDQIGGAKCPRQLELPGIHVDGDDPPAPAMIAPCTELSPTPPQPMTATVLPGVTLAVLKTAPRPVVTAHPISAARSSGISSRIFTRVFSWTSIISAKAERRRTDGSGAIPGQAWWLIVTPLSPWRSQRTGRPETVFSGDRRRSRQPMTWSPGFTWVTSAPTA